MNRLAIYFPHFDHRPAGLGRYTVEICGRLLLHFADIDLYTETPESVPSTWLDRLTVRRIPTRELPQRLRPVARQAWLQTRLPLELKRNGASVLLVPFHEGMIKPTIPQVVVVHDLTPLVVPSAYFHPLARAFMRILLPRVLRRASVVAVSQNTRSDIARLLGIAAEDVHIIAEGYDRNVFRPRDRREIDEIRRRHGVPSPYLFYSGTYAAHKNVRLLVEVLSICVNRGFDLHLVLGGRRDAGDFQTIREQIRRAGLQSRVRTLGYLEREELSALMAGALAFVFPSLYEGFGLAALEAMASGAVVLSSNRASLPEVVGNGGILLDPTDAVPWADAVADLARRPELDAKWRKAAIARASEFDWDRCAAKLAGVLRTAAAGTKESFAKLVDAEY